VGHAPSKSFARKLDAELSLLGVEDAKLGLRERRVDLARRRIEVIDVRHDAGRFGAGYKNRPRATPGSALCRSPNRLQEQSRVDLVGCPPGGLVFSGPGGSHGVKRGERSMLSTGNYRRVYKAAVATAALPHLIPTRRGWRKAASQVG
jgi:hypothetical protein